MKSTIFFFILVSCSLGSTAQTFTTNLFIRTPQVVNYNFNTEETSYISVLSAGIGITHQAKFIEFAAFITPEDVHGFYSFFGSTIKAKSRYDDWTFYTNWYGEFTHVPKQKELSSSNQYATGLCFFLNRSFEWGSIGFPFCIGLAYDKDFVLNTRSIINVSIKL